MTDKQFKIMAYLVVVLMVAFTIVFTSGCQGVVRKSNDSFVMAVSVFSKIDFDKLVVTKDGYIINDFGVDPDDVLFRFNPITKSFEVVVQGESK